MKTILAATDLSLRSERAVRRAFALAGAHGAAVRLVHVVDDDLPEGIAARRSQEAREEIERFCAALPGAQGIEWSVEVLAGDAVPAILEAAEAAEADLVVTGIPRARWLLDVFGGTTAERLARTSLRPVLLVSIAAETPYTSILTGLDLSPASAAAARTAKAMAPGAKVTGFHAVHIPYAGLTAGGEHNALGAPFMSLAKADLEGWMAATKLDETIGAPRLEEGGVTVVFARMMEELKPQVVAVGAHGRGGLSPTLLGRFAADLLRDPPCDLLLVRR
ncbi:universal stress protein [Albimonas sp. CAU 1670]|uniref:universal stress protein n=1 Tax=Albimonas sp. CAU 1670 TaxID=3032599 RepID=UPI0023D9ACC5|nr:universal stress protein [Albimonas sp. CAU 1670]MDF2231880.1 universal stress protein [Albimonas sp. CAU 1670]